jgi:peptide/nickel transport system substrate-binding protein
MLDPAAGGDSYYTGYDNPQLASLVQQAAAEQDPDKRADLYAQVQEISANEVPQTTTFYESHSYAWSSKVHDFQVNPLYQTRYDDVWIGQ